MRLYSYYGVSFGFAWWLSSWLISVAQALTTTTATTTSSCGFKSCPSPRFDDFSQALTSGTWEYRDETTMAPSNLVVEEVMRSCGGAVQGIREPMSCFSLPISSNDEDGEESVYLNRANDGFVYFHDASYSLGPTELTFSSTTDDSQLLLSSLCFGKHRFVGRAFVSMKPNEAAETTLACHEASMVHERKANSEIDLVTVNLSYDPPTLSLASSAYTQCRMASPSQPWMLPRAKWETWVDEHKGENEPNPTEDSSTREVFGWITAQSMSDFRQDSPHPPQVRGEAAWVLSMGATFGSLTKASTRYYGSDGKLGCVQLLQGSLAQELNDDES